MTDLMDEQVPAEPEVPFEEPEPEVEPAPDELEESEQGEEEAEAAAETVPAPEGMSIEELEKVRKQLDKSATTWRNRVSQLLGEEAQNLVPCELCDPLIPGFHFPAEFVPPRDELHARLLDVLRAPTAPALKDDPYTQLCPVCDGYGETNTRSHVPGKGKRVCPACKGLGFQSSDAQPVVVPQNGQVDDIVYELPSDQPLVVDDKDAWGSPKILGSGQENPNWGRMPQYKDPTLP